MENKLILKLEPWALVCTQIYVLYLCTKNIIKIGPKAAELIKDAFAKQSVELRKEAESTFTEKKAGILTATGRGVRANF